MHYCLVESKNTKGIVFMEMIGGTKKELILRGYLPTRYLGKGAHIT